MELVIWVIFETICVLAHLLMSMIPVADPVWGWTLSAYSQVFITLISIYIFRSYLCKEPALRSLGRKELKYCVWAAVIGVGICLGQFAWACDGGYILPWGYFSRRKAETGQPLCSPYFKFPVCNLAFKRRPVYFSFVYGRDHRVRRYFDRQCLYRGGDPCCE